MTSLIIMDKCEQEKTATNKTKNDMSTTNNVIEIKAYSLAELANLYGISNRIMKTWLAPFTDDIGKKHGRYYITLQVKIIFEKLGLPGKAEE